MSSEPNLYAPPSASLEAEGGAPSGARYGPYRDAGFRGGLAIVGLALSALLAVALFLAFPEPPASPEDPRALQFAALALFAVGLSIYTIVTFCMWFHRVYANLPALGVATPRFTPGWAVGSFFIPILNLLRPFQAAREAWTATEAALDGDTLGFVAERGSGIVTAWWIAWIGSGLVSNFQRVAPAELTRAADAAFYRVVVGVETGLSALAAVLAIAVILGLNRRQRQAATRRGFAAN